MSFFRSKQISEHNFMPPCSDMFHGLCFCYHYTCHWIGMGNMASCPEQHPSGGGTEHPNKTNQNGDICAIGILSLTCMPPQ